MNSQENRQQTIDTGGGKISVSGAAAFNQGNISGSTIANTINPLPNDYSAPVASASRQSIPGKLVVLKLGDGNLETGFPVTLQIGEDGALPSTEILGRLPPAPTVISNYQRWQSIYRSGYKPTSLIRLNAPANQQTNISIEKFIKDCNESGDVFINSLNTWFNSELFRPCKDACLKKLNQSEPIRVILQTEDSRLRRIPWHLWDFFEEYRQAEIAVSLPEFDRADKRTLANRRTQVRILAILGDRTGIDIQKDRELLAALPNSECVFLVEPNRTDVDNYLWQERGWDILFFAGHSSSQSNAETGHIYINKRDRLTVSELRYALRKAIEGGLQLAIFNSCDGMGIAGELAPLHVPQIVLMREPVPDLVAQEFLKHFLKAFSSGESFYLAVRQARERLQGLENLFPRATWLPAICQNPAELPITWHELLERC